MANDSTSLSVWRSEVRIPDHQPLTEDKRVNVCVIGAGISGLTTAWLLVRAGRSVIVLDDGPIGGGETGSSTAHITAALDDRYCELEKLHGASGARVAAESHTAAIAMIEQIASDLGIDCDFERLDGYLFVPPGESTELLGEELRAVHRAGLLDVEYITESPLPFFDIGNSLRFPSQGQFNPLKYLRGVAQAIEREGGTIYCGTHVDDVEGGDICRVRTRDGATITADAVVVATNTPISERFGVHLKQSPYRTFVIGLRVPSSSVPLGLYWDTPDPYHYIRIERGPDVGYDTLIVGGEDHRTGEADDAEQRYQRLEAWSRERFPMAQDLTYTWSGQVMEPIDGMAFIGQSGDKGIYIITGDSGNGITHGTVGGIIVSDLVLGRDNPWAALYDPSRVKPGAIGELLSAGSGLIRDMAEWFTPGEVESVDDIPRGGGAILRDGLAKIAVHRDADGDLHELSAACTHVGCIVHWNSEETSWDCPCHGSRFDPYGKVLNGPATSDLTQITEQAS